MKCIRCEQTVRIGSTERCPRNPSGGEHEGPSHDFVPGAFDGLCNFIDDDGLRCGFGRDEWEDDIIGAPIHNWCQACRGYICRHTCEVV